MSNRIDAMKADQQNFLDKTEDEVKTLPSSVPASAMESNPDLEAVAAITNHMTKYDVLEEDEKSAE